MIQDKKQRAIKIFSILQQQNPKPETELKYNNNFTLAIAVILSAQSTDNAVNKATNSLFTKYDTPEKILHLGLEGLKKYIKTIGLYNAKAQNIIKLSEILITKYNSTIPENFEDLMSLPGIGRKTANVILNCAFDKETIAVDTHVFRVSKRLGLTEANTPENVEKDLMQIISAPFLQYAHHWLILHGRYICKARIALCEKCPISQYCDFFEKKFS
jgi:endonuclease-3